MSPVGMISSASSGWLIVRLSIYAATLAAASYIDLVRKDESFAALIKCLCGTGD